MFTVSKNTIFGLNVNVAAVEQPNTYYTRKLDNTHNIPFSSKYCKKRAQ